MKRTHKINHGWQRTADPISEAYQHELDRTAAKAETRWRQAQKAVERAQQAQQRAEQQALKKATPRTIAARDEARRLVLQRLSELRQIEELMHTPTYSPTTAVHRTGRQDRLEVGTYRKPKKNRRAA
ncbi:hypothetical protein [Streptomyces xanthophaeus]|uniref:hypothetical protein n=1 Tax=Streptomyces xanthophaeus TaxID=67385 RepID=UPI0026497359|nr:hypothetical protein [Streptomyces xanthophaeus]WKD36532.1 hypothetical protein KO717_34430 [Streptomyces xanthophaeus]